MGKVVIRAELEGRLKAWADAQTPKIPVSYEGVSFQKPTDGAYLECFLLPAGTIDVDVGATRKRHVGIFQINCWVKSGTGLRKAETLAQNIVDLFPILPKTGVVSIESTPHVDDSIPDPAGWIAVPVTVVYRYEN